MSKGWIKLVRDSEDVDEMIRQRPSAFTLLTIIARRAKRTDTSKIKQLEIGQAYIGDYELYGATEQTYRTDKKFLEKWKFATFQSTNRGTVATLVGTTIYDINTVGTNDPANEQLTNSQRTANEQLTTTKNVKKVKKVKKRETPPPEKLTQEQVSKMAHALEVSPSLVRSYYESVLDYERSKGKKLYKDYVATTRTWLRRDLNQGKIEKAKFV